MALICPKCTRNNRDSALHCKHCGTGLMGAVHVPNQSIFQPRYLVVLAIGVLLFAWAAGRINPPPAGDPTRLSARIAYDRCQEAVKAQLVAPDTTEFPPFDNARRGTDPHLHRFTGEGESQNRLGVPLQFIFECEITEDENGVYRIVRAEVVEL